MNWKLSTSFSIRLKMWAFNKSIPTFPRACALKINMFSNCIFFFLLFLLLLLFCLFLLCFLYHRDCDCWHAACLIDGHSHNAFDLVNENNLICFFFFYFLKRQDKTKIFESLRKKENIIFSAFFHHFY